MNDGPKCFYGYRYFGAPGTCKYDAGECMIFRTVEELYKWVFAAHNGPINEGGGTRAALKHAEARRLMGADRLIKMRKDLLATKVKKTRKRRIIDEQQ